MKRFCKLLLKLLKWFFLAELCAAVILLAVRVTGKLVNRRVPADGLNEAFFADINGTKQWVSIYAQNKDAPVLLYLHGGPCAATSAIDWTCLHKLAGDYVVVNWDQRGCGHNYPAYAEDTALTAEIMMQDGEALTDYLRERFGREKITLMGMSWGSLLGANLALAHPEKYDAVIALSLVTDIADSQTRYKEYVLEKSADDPGLHALAESIDPAVWTVSETERLSPLNAAYNHFDNYFTDADVNFLTTFLFNPHATLAESWRMIYGTDGYNDYRSKTLMPEPAALIAPLSLHGRTEYQVPFYLVEGADDHGSITMAEEAAAYFEQVHAPDKAARFISGGHNAPMMQTEALAEFVHEIAQKQP